MKHKNKAPNKKKYTPYKNYIRTKDLCLDKVLCCVNRKLVPTMNTRGQTRSNDCRLPTQLKEKSASSAGTLSSEYKASRL